MNKRCFFIRNTIALTLMMSPIVVSSNVDSAYAVNNNLFEVTVSSLNVRSGASTSYSIIGKLSKGDRVEVYESNKGWAKIKLNGKYGYCSEQYLKAISSNTNNASSVNMSVYLRSESNWSAKKITVISKGEKVSVLSTSGGWSKVTYNGETGYVPTEYLETPSLEGSTNNSGSTNSGGSTNNNANGSQTNKVIKITTDNLNLRKGASTSYSIIMTIPKNKQVTVISSSNGWDYVEYDGKKGYVSNKYLKLSTNESPNVQAPEIIKVNKIEFNVTNNSLTQKIDVVSDSELEYSHFYLTSPKRLVIDFKNCELKQGTNMSDIGVNGSVIKLYRASYKSEDGSTRLVIEIDDKYDTKNVNINKNKNTVSIDFVIKNNEVNAPSEENIYYTTADSLNVRSGGGTSYSVIGKLSEGTAVNVISISNGWAKIKYNDGYGYCSVSYLVKYSNNQSIDEQINAVINLAKKQLGKPYKYGASGPDSFDCSGFMYYIHKEAIGLVLPRTSSAQSVFGVSVNKSNLRIGDLLFFDSDKNGTVNHVGMYIGNGEWIHSPKPGDVVKISKMEISYVNHYLVGIRRVIN